MLELNRWFVEIDAAVFLVAYALYAEVMRENAYQREVLLLDMRRSETGPRWLRVPILV